VYRYEKKSHTWSELPYIAELSDGTGWNQPKHYSTIHLADVDGRDSPMFLISIEFRVKVR
jgi:hypothetical protein